MFKKETTFQLHYPSFVIVNSRLADQGSDYKAILRYFFFPVNKTDIRKKNMSGVCTRSIVKKFRSAD